MLGLGTEAHAGKFSGLGRAVGAVVGKTATASAATVREPDLNRDALRSCVALAERIKGFADPLFSQRTRLEEEAATLDAEFADLEARRAKLNRASASAVNRFNATLDNLQRRARAHDGQVETFNARLASHRRDVASFDAGCASKTYRESDMQAIQDEAGRRG
jgi:chromosome segregation ATPase